MKKVGVVTFPGSNCDQDCQYAVEVMGHKPIPIWHRQTQLPRDLDALILPGGFSYGDYLRSGAIARFSEIMAAVGEFAKKGGPILGICNGFQVLVEAGLLPGALMINRNLKFICKPISIRVDHCHHPFTRHLDQHEVLTMPIAHGDGNYYIDGNGLKRLEDQGQILFRYCSKQGDLQGDFNPNGSLGSIAGITNEQNNIVGMMPHPERAIDSTLKMTDGHKLLQSFLGKS